MLFARIAVQHDAPVTPHFTKFTVGPDLVLLPKKIKAMLREMIEKEITEDMRRQDREMMRRWKQMEEGRYQTRITISPPNPPPTFWQRLRASLGCGGRK